jgi:hypothetical protein
MLHREHSCFLHGPPEKIKARCLCPGTAFYFPGTDQFTAPRTGDIIRQWSSTPSSIRTHSSSSILTNGPVIPNPSPSAGVGESLPPMTMFPIYWYISSTSPRSNIDQSRVPPPSTMRLRTPISYRWQSNPLRSTSSFPAIITVAIDSRDERVPGSIASEHPITLFPGPLQRTAALAGIRTLGARNGRLHRRRVGGGRCEKQLRLSVRQGKAARPVLE